MHRDRDPEAEKQRDYEKQFRSAYGESRQAERKNRPKRRARTHRAARRAVQQVLGAHDGGYDLSEADRVEDSVAQVRLGNFSISTANLRSHVAGRRRYRAAEAGRRFSRQPYDPALHREPFAQFLRSVVNGGVAPQVELAERFSRLLGSTGAGAKFLEMFLADNPGWRSRLQRWCERTLANG